MPDAITSSKPTQELAAVTIRFAGDSGDGMQLTGERFAAVTALAGNDFQTLPDFPAEIRAPAGTLSGVSGFQIHLGSHRITTPGDRIDVLVAMNPAALKTAWPALKSGAMLILNDNTFTEADLKKASYESNPLDDGSLDTFDIRRLPMNRLTEEALAALPLSPKEKDRCKNFFVLGLVSWLYTRPIEPTQAWIEKKFSRSPELARANALAFEAGYRLAETSDLFPIRYVIPKAPIQPGRYRKITGNEAAALACVAAGQRAGKPVVFASYPITPASDILHELARHKQFDMRTIQAEDEIAAACAAIGASYAGSVGVTATSGPGLDLKTEAIGLAVMAELPLVVIDVQRGGPSTGLPTKTEQADLLQALHGRHGECPVVVLAASTPGDCFFTVYEACRLAIKYMTPVIVLSDAFLANGAEPWRIPDVAALPEFEIPQVSEQTSSTGFHPYARDAMTLARPWVPPGTPGLEHRIGGLEKEHVTGNVSYDPVNHETMVAYRAEKIQRVTADIPPLTIHGSPEGAVLVIGWGSTWGAITAAVEQAQQEGRAVSSLHVRHLHPLPCDLLEIARRFETIMVPELNTGHLQGLLQTRLLRKIHGLHKIQGQPFLQSEIYEAIARLT
ncbi:MAG: 2-oxoacid:acceptor oxidoreductase subunit alpha [Nitrospirae bacterium]|nr:MAG: 2-oxoacid:acceptor oxidoreductase subunit alpha [Nitrospirota bacterium]